jgi:DNA-binding MarR family transcriptional regulator
LNLSEVSQKYSNILFERRTTTLQPGEVKTLSFKWTAKVYARSIRAEVKINGSIVVEEIETEDNWMLEQVYVDPIDDDPIPSAERDDGMFTPETAAVGGLGLGIIGAILVFFGSKDLFRYPFFLALGPLYSKLKPEHLLNNRLRKRIYVYVQNHPGEHFRSILTHLNLTNGTLAHHLYTLEKEDLIRSQRDGLYRRFYPAGYQIDPNHISLTSIQQRIMDQVREEPGLSQKEISQKLELSNSTVNYNIKSMKEKELIVIKKDGKNTRIFPSPDQNS